MDKQVDLQAYFILAKS